MDFILSTNDLNSYGYRVLTSGIKYAEKFPMLFDHDSSKVIGQWENLKKLEDKLIASGRFDEFDEEAMKIKKKCENNFINSTSIGFNVLDFEEVDGVINITNCELLEASIVAIPANKSALKLYRNKKELKFENMDELKLSLNGEELTSEEITKIKSKKHIELLKVEEGETLESFTKRFTTDKNMKKLFKNEELNIQAENIFKLSETPEVENAEEDIKPLEVEEVTEVEETPAIEVEEVPVVEIPVEETPVETTELQADITIFDERSELSEKIQNLSMIITAKDLEISKLSEKIKEFETKELSNKINTLVDKLLKENKIDAGQVDTLKELGHKDFDMLSKLSETFKPKNTLQFNQMIKKENKELNDKDNWSFDQWRKNDPKGLKELKDTNPEKYSEILKGLK